MPSIDSLISLQDPDGTELDVRSVTFGETVNGGWTWSAELNSTPPLDDFLEDETYTLSVEADGEAKTLPPLIAQTFEKNVMGPGGTLGGIDLVMYRLTRSTHVLPLFRNTTSEDLIDYMAAQMAMTGLVTGHDVWSFPVLEFEETGRTNMLVHLLRLLDVAGYEFRVVRDGSDAVLETYPLEFAPTGDPGPQPAWTSAIRKRDRTSRITQLGFLKSTRMSDAFVVPTSTGAGTVYDLGDSFHSAQSTAPNVTFWNGDPGLGGTQVGGTGVSYDNGPFTHARVEDDSGPLVIRGTAANMIPTGVELAFYHPHDSGITPPRPADEPWEESLFPSLAYVQDRAELYTWVHNRHTHGMSWQGPPCLWLGLGYALEWPGEPDSRVESYSTTLGNGQASTTAESATLGTAQW